MTDANEHDGNRFAVWGFPPTWSRQDCGSNGTYRAFNSEQIHGFGQWCANRYDRGHVASTFQAKDWAEYFGIRKSTVSEIIKKHFKPLLDLVNASQNDLESRNDSADLESRNDTAVANDSCLELPLTHDRETLEVGFTPNMRESPTNQQRLEPAIGSVQYLTEEEIRLLERGSSITGGRPYSRNRGIADQNLEKTIATEDQILREDAFSNFGIPVLKDLPSSSEGATAINGDPVELFNLNENDKQRFCLVDGLPLLLRAKEISMRARAEYRIQFSKCMLELKRRNENKQVTTDILLGRTVNHLIREAARTVFVFHPVFENLVPDGQKDIDVGTGLRLECKGDQWTNALLEWLERNKGKSDEDKIRIELGVDLLQVVMFTTNFQKS